MSLLLYVQTNPLYKSDDEQVLWPDCGWEPVSLTDLITSSNVKKVYRKATLCVHPDKVQQKGATIQQKYTAEKVFDILKVRYQYIILSTHTYQRKHLTSAAIFIRFSLVDFR